MGCDGNVRAGTVDIVVAIADDRGVNALLELHLDLNNIKVEGAG